MTLLYQAVMFCFATPLNTFFLFYVAYLGLAVWSVVFLVRGTDLAAFDRCLSPRAPTRAGRRLCPGRRRPERGGVARRDRPDRIQRASPSRSWTATGLLTNPVYIQDLAIWLPLLAIAAVAAWRHRVWGQLDTAAMLTLFVLESLSISVDQCFGSLQTRCPRGHP